MVERINNYLKKFGHPTIVMTASLRKVGTIAVLGGCDKLMMPPSLIEELEKAFSSQCSRKQKQRRVRRRKPRYMNLYSDGPE